MTARDSQRGKVYAAENATDWPTKATRWLTATETDALARRMHRWLATEGIHVSRLATVRFPTNGNGGAHANRGNGELMFTRRRPSHRACGHCAPTEDRYYAPWIVAHEVAHLAYPGKVDGYNDTRSHGAAFCHVYLRLVRRFFGVPAEKALKASFRAHGVRYTRPRQLTPEARQAAAERLAAHRPARTRATTEWVAVHRELTARVGYTVYLTARWADAVRERREHADGSVWYAGFEGRTGARSKALSRVSRDALVRAIDRAGWWPIDDYELVELPRPDKSVDTRDGERVKLST